MAVRDHSERGQRSGSDQTSVDVIELALTPVFLLAAVAALLNVFSTRLGRVADRVDLLSSQGGAADTESLSAQLDRLRRRSHYLDWAVVFATIGGMATCFAATGVFLSTLLRDDYKVAVFVFFATALLCTIIALILFLIEMVMAGRGLRGVVRQQQGTVDKSQLGPNT